MAEIRTFVFTDIVRSVGLKSEMPGRSDTERDRAFLDTILTPHREKIDVQLAEHGGRVVSTAGDGHFLVFENAIRAAQWAIEVQTSHDDDPIFTPKQSRVAVRVSLHMGVPQIDPRDENNFVGKPVDYAARLNDFAQGGQILCSRAISAVLDDAQLEGIHLYSHGQRMLRGIGRIEVYEVVYRASGPMGTIYHPAKEQKREWTVIPAGSTARSGYPATSPPGGGSAQATALHAASPRRLGNYELGELLGSGGMGDVYKARHALFDRTRAIKVIKQRLVDAGRTDVVRRFYQEIKAVGQLEHKNIIVAIESSAPDDNVHYLVMEFIDGISLDELVIRHGPLAAADACEAIRQAARGLQYIHRFGMVHRDIKPSNLMLTVQDRRESLPVGDSSTEGMSPDIAIVKILDLGLALLADENQERLTEFGQRAMGTGMYMSPEQWKTTSVDIRADIYSLGCTLYHLLAGHPPFFESDLKPEKAHEKSHIPPIDGRTKIPRKLWDVIKKMLAKHPDDRYQTPQEVVEQLAPFSQGHQLVELLPKYISDEPSDPSVVPTRATAGPQIDTLPIESSSTGKWEGIRRSWRWQAVAAMAVIAAALAYLFWRDPPLRNDPISYAAAAQTVGTLPGMNGLWWFEERPEFFPAARLRMLASMKQSDWDELQVLIRSPDVRPLYESLTTLRDRNLPLRESPLVALADWKSPLFASAVDVLSGYDPLAPVPKEFTDLVRRLESSPNPLTAAQQHLLGVLYAHQQEFARADDQLASAVDAYREHVDAPDPILAAAAQAMMDLVSVDRAHIALARADYAPARQHLRTLTQTDVAAIKTITPNHVYVWGLLSLTSLRDSEESTDRIQRELLQAQMFADAIALEDAHPLRAYLWERTAHAALDTWRLQDAVLAADEAAQRRNVFAKMEGQQLEKIRTGSHHAQQAWFRAKQIESLAKHFQGTEYRPNTGPGLGFTATQAWKEFDELIYRLTRVDEYRLTSEQKRAWHQLDPNFRGRHADCEMFTMGRFPEAAGLMNIAVANAQELEWQDDPEKQHHFAFMLYKQAIALALSQEIVKARTVVEGADKLTKEIPARKHQRFQLFADVAKALTSPEVDRYDALQQVFRRGAQEELVGAYDRDKLQILLFVSDYLQAHEDATEHDNEQFRKSRGAVVKVIQGGDDNASFYYFAHVRSSAQAALSQKPPQE